MKKVFAMLALSLAFMSCRQTGNGDGQQPYDAHETGPEPTQEATQGGQKTGYETLPDSTARDQSAATDTSHDASRKAKQPANEVTPPEVSKKQ